MSQINWISVLCILLVVAGCGAVAKVEVIPNVIYQPHTNKVCFLNQGLGSSFKYTPLGRIVSTKRSYGSTDELYRPMAVKARSIGAYAVINLHKGQRFKGPLPWRIVSPTAYGEAVRIEGEGVQLDCLALGGQLH